MRFWSDNMSRTIGIFTESSDGNPEIDLCRLCREKHDCYYSIFTSNVAYNITVKDALHDLVGLQITVGDGLPTTMCPLCLKKLTEFSVFKKICLESDAVLRKSCFRPNTLTASQGEKVQEAQSRGNIVADLDLTLFGAKKELSPEENAQALKGGADTDVSEGDLPEDQQSEEYDEESFCLRLESDSDEGDECSDAGTKVPTLSEDGDPFESSATAYESAIGVPAAEAMLEQTSTPYVLAEGSTRNHSIDECIGPKPKATQVVSKAGTSHEEIGKNLIDEDLKKCGASETDEISSCSIPDDRQCNNKDIESLTSSRVGAAMAVVGEKSGCDAPNTSHNHRFIRISRNDRSDCETIVGGNNEVLNCLIENPGNSYSSNEDSYNCVNCRDVFNNKKELMKHMKIHFAARKFDAAAESSIVDVSLEALPSSGHSSSCEPTTSKALSGQERKRLKPIQKENVLIKETSGGKGDEKNIRRLTISFTVGEKSATQRLSSKSSSIRNLRNHLGPRKEERLYSCTVCNESFTQKRDLTVHKSTHTGGKRYSCGTCSKSFTHRGHLDIHSRTHAVEKPFTCKVCSESFPRKNILNAHVRRHTGERPFSCDVCEKSFSVKGNLVRHVRRHAGEKLFSCNECEKSFLWKSDLVRHVHTHTGGKIFPCRICDKSFTEKSVLRRHIRIHTGEKPFICKVCSKSFSRKDNLDAHARTHTGEKPYSCNECEKSFSVKGNLVRHVRTHTGEKPFSCNDCEKSFTDKSTLVIHVRTHTGEKNFSCRICDKSFARKSVLKRHSRTHGREAFFMQ